MCKWSYLMDDFRSLSPDIVALLCGFETPRKKDFWEQKYEKIIKICFLLKCKKGSLWNILQLKFLILGFEPLVMKLFSMILYLFF